VVDEDGGERLGAGDEGLGLFVEDGAAGAFRDVDRPA
jgi:hypothetical protein